jgi:hypothetical protein
MQPIGQTSIILQIGLGVNPASKNVSYEPEAPASGLDWHARMDHRWSYAAPPVTVLSSCALRSDDTDARTVVASGPLAAGSVFMLPHLVGC